MENRIAEYIEKKLKDSLGGKGNLLVYQILVKLSVFWLASNLKEQEIYNKIDFLTNGNSIGIESAEEIYNILS